MVSTHTKQAGKGYRVVAAADVAGFLLFLLRLLFCVLLTAGKWNHERRSAAGGYIVILGTGGFNAGVSFAFTNEATSLVFFLAHT